MVKERKNPCPGREDLEALACGSSRFEQTQVVNIHIASCARCRDILKSIKADRFLFNEIYLAVHDVNSKKSTKPIITKQEGFSKADVSPKIAVDSIDGYEIEKEIHRGGQGVIYKAVQDIPRRDVAIKVLLGGSFSSARERYRFEREVALMASLRHPNIVTVFESSTDPHRPYFTMEYVNGQRFDSYCAKQVPSFPKLIVLFQKICSAIHYAHQHGIMHRDLKPGNILIDEAGEPRILDFGLAKSSVVEQTTIASVTVTGEFMGTLAYASPEQVSGDPVQVDVRTDIYSLGVILYEALTGQLPYDCSAKITEVLRNIAEQEPLSLRSINPAIDSDLETIVLKALAKDKQRRYQSAEALANDLGHYILGEPIEAKRDSTWYVVRKVLKQHRIPVAVASAMFTIVVGFAITMTVMYQRAESEAIRAKHTQVFLEELLSSASAENFGPDVKLLEVLALAEQRMKNQLADEPEVEASVRLVIGRTYASIRTFGLAQRHLREALRLNREIYGSSHQTVATCLSLLGNVLAREIDSASIKMQREALAIRRKLYGEQDVLVAQSTMDLASALWRCGNDNQVLEAEQLNADAISRYRQAGYPARLGLARSLHSSASLYLRNEDYDRAKPLLEEALSIHRELDDNKHPYAVELINDYAAFLGWSGEFELAETMLRESLVVTPRAFGQVSMPYLLWELGKVRHALGDFKDAESMYRESLAKSCVRLADKFPSFGELLLKSAGPLLSAQGDELADASTYLELFQYFRTIKRVPKGQLAQGLFDLGVLRLDMKDVLGSQMLLHESLDIRNELLPKSFLLIAETKSALGECFTKLKKYSEAEPLLVSSYLTIMKKHGEESKPAKIALSRVLSLYEVWKKPDRAETYIGRNLETLPTQGVSIKGEPSL